MALNRDGVAGDSGVSARSPHTERAAQAWWRLLRARVVVWLALALSLVTLQAFAVNEWPQVRTGIFVRQTTAPTPGNARFWTMDLSGNTITYNDTAAFVGYNFNAIGYYPADDFVYGLQWLADGGDNLTITAINNTGAPNGTTKVINGYRTETGAVMVKPLYNMNLGTFSWKNEVWAAAGNNNGHNYYFGSSESQAPDGSRELFVVDFTQVAPNVFARRYLLSGDNVTRFGFVNDGDLPAGDIAFNPRDGKLYTLHKSGDLYSITLTTGATNTGVVEFVKHIPGISELTDFGGLWIQARQSSAYLFAFGNASAKMYRIKLDGANSSLAGQSSAVAGATSTLNDGTAYPIEPAQSDIVLTKAANPSSGGTVGQNVTFTITAHNNGPDTADLLIAVDSLPASYTYQSHVASAGTTFTPGTGSWDVGQLTNGANATLTIVARLDNNSSNCSNTITVTSSGSEDDVTSNNTATSSDPCGSSSIVATKTTPSVNVSAGDLVPYSVTFTNGSSSSISSIVLQDQVPPGFKYKAGSATIGACTGTSTATASEPVVAGRLLSWSGQSFTGNECKRIRMLLVVGSGVGVGDYINQTWAEQNNVVFSNVASATVRVVPDPTFDCSDIIGKVFDDKNANGYHDQSEPGVANVRVVTVNGLLVKTDHEGRFHVACSDIPQAERGSNFIMKLDERSLPSGYRVTTENPRVVRTTRGKMTKLNFGAAIHRVVRVDLMDAAFETDKPEPTAALAEALKKLPETLKEKPSVVRLAYRVGQDGADLARDRVQAIRKQVEKDWKDLECCYTLHFEEEFIEPAVAAKESGK